MVAFDRADYDWTPDADPADATLAFLAEIERDERGRRLARLELVDDDEAVVGTATVTATDLPAFGDGDGEAATGTAVYRVTVADGRLTELRYDADLSRQYHEEMLARIERLADDG